MLIAVLIIIKVEAHLEKLQPINSVFGISQNFLNLNTSERILQSNCHYSCQTCYGPQQNNCLSCNFNFGRRLDIENSMCICDQYLLEVDGEEKCKSFNDILPNSYFSSSTIEKKTTCLFGEFQIYINSEDYICKQCPFNNLQCVDCYANPQTWYLNPICTKDYKIFQQNIMDLELGSILTYRDLQDYEVFIITKEFQLKYCPFYFHICSLEESQEENLGCQQTFQTHLNKKISALCKSFTYFENDDCYPCQQNCISCQNRDHCDQCKKGFYFNGFQCLECPKNCKSCNFENNEISCETCVEFYGVLFGQCLKCGGNCHTCISDLDHDYEYFLRCVRCSDPVQFYLSANVIDCFPNNLSNCKHVTQTDDLFYFYLTSSFYRFQEFYYQETVYDFCLRCESGYDLDKNGECVESFNYPDCSFYYVGKYFEACLIGITQIDQQNDNCWNLITNCESCVYEHFVQKYVCIKCLAGYYADRLLGYCIECPTELKCQTCYQQQMLENDNWTVEIRAAFEGIIGYALISNEESYYHYFRSRGQSKDIKDYEIICEICQEGYELYNEICIEVCPSNCIQCQVVDGKNQCIKCGYDSKGRIKSIVNNCCILCPSNCLLCQMRQIEEIQKINPYFNNPEFQSFSNQCIQQQNTFNTLSYDFDIGQFVICSSNQLQCDNELIIKYNLYCDKNLYENILERLNTQTEKDLFISQNIFLQDFLINGLKNIQNFDFYQSANIAQLKKIVIQISSSIDQTCYFQNENIISLNFRKHIFSLKTIQLEFYGFNSTVFLITDIISFQNFTSIIFDSITLKFVTSVIIPVTQFKFSTLTMQDIHFKNINISSQIDEAAFEIIFENFQRIILQNIDFQIKNQKQTSGFFQFIQSISIQNSQISIESFRLSQSIFNSSNLFIVSAINQVNINFEKILIQQTNFLKSDFFICLNQQGCGNIIINESVFDKIFIVDSTFLNNEKSNSLLVQKTNFTNIYLRNSTLIDISHTAEIIKLVFKDISLSKSQLIANTLQMLIFSFNYKLYDLDFQNIEYDQSSRILVIQKFISTKSSLIARKLLVSHFKYVGEIPSNLKQLSLSLFFFEMETIELDDITLLKDVGLPYFSIKNSQLTKIQNSLFTSINGTVFKQNIQSMESQIRQSPILLLFSQLNLVLQNIQMKEIVSLNYPLIVYQSPQQNVGNDIETIQIKNSSFSNLLQFTNNLESQSIFEIKSLQNVFITFQDITFQNNIIYSFTSTNQVQISILIIVECLEGSLIFISCKFDSNLAIQSENTMIKILAKQVNFSDCKFQNNGVLTNQAIQIFQILEISEVEDKIFQTSGNGIINSDILIINECKFINQKGTQGSIINYTPLNDGIIIITNTLFQYSQNYFIFPNEVGGGIYVNSAQTNLKIQIINSDFSDIYSYEGGFLSIEEIQGKVEIFLNNSKITNIFSLMGSLLSVKFTEFNYLSSLITLNNISVQNENKTFYYFCELMSLDLSKNSSLWSSIFNTRALISTYLSSIIIQNSKFFGLINEIILKDKSVHGFYGENILIYESYLSSEGLFSLQPIQGKKVLITLKNLRIFSLSIINWWNLSQQYDNQFHLTLESIQNQILSNFSILDQNLEIQSLIMIEGCHSLVQITLNKLLLKEIVCTSCFAGLIYFQFNNANDKNIKIQDLRIQNNNCGQSSCFLILETSIVDFDLNKSYENTPTKQEFSIFYIDSFICSSNKANIGTCLFLENHQGTINNSIFQNNSADSTGGAIFYCGKQLNIKFFNTQIFENSALYGGGIAFQKSFTSFQHDELFLQFNVAKYYGNQDIQQPSKLKMQLISSNFLNSKLLSESNKTRIIEQCYSQNQTTLNQNNFIKLPCGQKISSYQIFDWESNEYNNENMIFRLIPFDKYDTQIKGMNESKCVIKGRLLNVTEPDQYSNKVFANNFTNLQAVYYNTKNEDYDLDDLIIYFDPDLPVNLVLQLQFQCDSIKIPIYQNQEIIDQSDEYYLRVNIKTFPCQLGELKLETDKSCHPCDYTQDLYSVVLNATKCNIRDNQIMEQVKSAQIKLRTGYWRPYINTDDIENCYNQQSNCQGGWDIGDKSCAIGYIGALCEQCDIHNIKGEGSYSISKKYSCGSCDDTKSNTLIIIGISLWTLISILISVKSTVEIVKQLARATKLKSIGISIVVNKNNAVNLIKILTNYLQIIASVTTFQLSLPKNMDYFINSLGNPIETMAYSLDCFLKDMFQNIEIQYSRTIWQLIMPILYIFVFFLLYGAAIALKKIEYSFCVISTTLIYMFIYLQPNIVAGQIGLLSYRTISNFKWILGNVAFRYDTSSHSKWMLSYSLPVLIIIGIGLPLFFFLRLQKIKNFLNLLSNRLVWGYLYNEYKQIAYYWEIVKIIQKVLIILSLTFYQDQIIVKAAIVYAVIFIYNYFTLLINPYQSMKLNFLDHESTRICGVSIVLGVGIYGALQSEILEIQIPFYLILGFVNFLFLIKLIIEIIQAYFEKFEVVLDKTRDLLRKIFPQLLKYPYLQQILKNKAAARERAIKNFKKAKAILIMISRQYVKCQDNQNQKLGTFIIDTQQTVNSSSKQLTQIQQRMSSLQQRDTKTFLPE